MFYFKSIHLSLTAVLSWSPAWNLQLVTNAVYNYVLFNKYTGGKIPIWNMPLQLTSCNFTHPLASFWLYRFKLYRERLTLRAKAISDKCKVFPIDIPTQPFIARKMIFLKSTCDFRVSHRREKAVREFNISPLVQRAWTVSSTRFSPSEFVKSSALHCACFAIQEADFWLFQWNSPGIMVAQG